MNHMTPLEERLRSVLKDQEERLRELLNALDMNDVPLEAAAVKAREIGDTLRRIRPSALRECCSRTSLRRAA